MPPIKNIRFSFPCNERIDQMGTCGINKHCQACERTIIDFRDKTSEELDLLKKTTTNICGIFAEKQVAKGYENYYQLTAATILAIGLSTSLQIAHAQEEPDPFKIPVPAKDSSASRAIVGVFVYDTPQADYPGGIQAMRKFIEENLVYPSDSVSGKVRVSFMVDTEGRTRHIQIRQSLSPLADSEVIRVIGLMVFNPAKENGKPVNSRLSLPITFNNGKKD